MAYYPAFLDLRGRLVLVVGGGQVAARKVSSLLAAGARVRLVAPHLGDECAELARRPEVEHLPRGFQPRDLQGVWLAVSATDRPEVNRAVARAAEAEGVFVNVVDVPELCSFIVPAVVRRGELALAVSTGGAAPAVARRLRRRLEEEFGPAWEPYLRLLRALRRRLLAEVDDPAARRERFHALAESELRERVAEGDAAGVDAVLARVLGRGWSLGALGWGAEELAPREGRP